MAEKYSHEHLHELESSDLICRGGTVTKVVDDRAYIKIDREKGCDSCSSKSHCGAMFNTETVFETQNTMGVVAGERVEIGLRPAAIVTASVLLFIFPTILFIAGIGIGYWLADLMRWEHQQWAGFIIGTILFAVSYGIIKLLTPRLERRGKYEPVITRVLEKTTETLA